MTAVIAISLLIGAAVGLIAGIVFYVLRDKGPDTAERDPSAVQIFCCHCGAPDGDNHTDWCPRAGWDVAESADVMSDLDGSHDNLDDVDQFRWAEEVIWLTEMYEADEVPIIPGRLPGEAS